MQASRRRWLKQIGLGVAGIGLGNFQSFAAPGGDPFAPYFNDLPIKLSANENPYGPSSLARAAMTNAMGLSNRYNWELTSELIEALADQNGVSGNHILMGAGSTEILDLVARFAGLKKGHLVIADPSFGYWTGAAEAMGLEKTTVPLTTGKETDLPAMLRAITQDTRLVYICNPNNPTGTVCNHDALLNFVREATAKTLVLVDEAYIDFTTQPSLSRLAAENKNLVVAKTFSKIYGLAGARVGYAIAHPETLERISTLQTWNNGSVGVVSAAAALAALKDQEFVQKTYLLNERTRKYTIEQLEQLKLECIPSSANFIYFSLSNYNGDYFQKLKDSKISGTKIYEEQGKWTRITVGTLPEMERYIQAIK